METMKWTAEQAMNALKIPASKQSEYKAVGISCVALTIKKCKEAYFASSHGHK